MNVYKFGGASVKNADAICNLESIVSKIEGNGLVIVISAMAKTTNALEEVVKAYFKGDDWKSGFIKIKSFHLGVVNELIPSDNRWRIHSSDWQVVFPEPGADEVPARASRAMRVDAPSEFIEISSYRT